LVGGARGLPGSNLPSSSAAFSAAALNRGKGLMIADGIQALFYNMGGLRLKKSIHDGCCQMFLVTNSLKIEI